MRILLIGEYSNVHHTLCEALRRAGHEVLLISDGDGWKDYPRDIDLRRRMQGPVGSACYLAKLVSLLPRLKNYDVVQLINPVFLDVKPRWNRWVFNYIKRHNRKVSVGCFGDDYYVISRMQDDKYLRYTDFYAQGRPIDHAINRKRIAAWLQGPKAELTRYVMAKADALIACLYEYYKVYATEEFLPKLHYLPLPIHQQAVPLSSPVPVRTSGDLVAHPPRPLRILLAVQKQRGQMKGTDQIVPLLHRLAQEYPRNLELLRIESVPFEQYCREVEAADVIVDQLYSYTHAMGALEAMRRGKVAISGGELCDFGTFTMQAPCINLRPFEDEVNYRMLEETLLDRQKIARLSRDSQAYVKKYHDADVVAQRFVEIVTGNHSSEASSRCPSHR